MQDKKPNLPPSIANLSLEESQKLNVDTLKKLKGRDRKLAELTALNEKLAAQQQPQRDSGSIASLQAANNVCAFELPPKPICPFHGARFCF